MNWLQRKNLLLVLETVHIPLWLAKDLCWLMTFKTFGLVMAIPTNIVAIVMAIITRKDRDRFLPNVAIIFWIVANTNWMLAEFYNLNTKDSSLYPFVLGLLVFGFYLVRKALTINKVEEDI